jgi:photosystem II stability/assembly factor-like uncharacterized protein
VVFAGTTAGLLRSDDGGKAFRVVSGEAIRSIAFDPAVPERIFFASTTAGLMVSTDGGRTLRTSNAGFTNRSFTALTSARGVLYATSVFEAGTGGVYRTDNYGLRWDRAGAVSADHAEREFRVISAAPDQPGTLVAAGYHGIVRSKDNGKTWAPLGGQSAGGQITALAALAHNVVLAGTGQGLYEIHDSTWQLATTGLSGGISAIDLSGSAVAAINSHGASVSTNDGATWRACGEPATALIWYGVSFDRAPGDQPSHQALAATSAGLFRSTDDCRSWTKVVALPAATVNVVLFHPTRAGEAFAAQDGRVLRSTDGGLHWEQLGEEGENKVWPASLVILPELPDRVYALLPRRGVSFAAFDPRRVEVVRLPHFALPKL